MDDDEGAVFAGAVFGGGVEEDAADVDERVGRGVGANPRGGLFLWASPEIVEDFS